jgi:hypothetical protein
VLTDKQVVGALVCRSPTFLAQEEWKTIPWSTGSSSKDLLQHLLDVVVNIPSVLAQFDSLVEASKTGSMSCSEANHQQTILWASSAGIKHCLQQWKREWADTYPFGQPYEVPTRNEDSTAFVISCNQLPTFRCRDLTTMRIVTPTMMAYPDPRMALAQCMYYASLLMLSGVDTKPGEVRLDEQYSLACLICRSMEYCMKVLLGGHINRVLFPLRVAYDILPDGDIEREWVTEVFKRIEKIKMIKWEDVAEGLTIYTKAA